ncbi:alpha/beta fold hydrolase [Lentzea tibetensis]|uniref:Alpha/beta fold hydrolase n=1 Tax=Lentzea tibetensis TaxID=2591470 RepID=A0A563EQ02_9PSEU|nr:alpha/beta fold hydrolase [Lentzea tibetensis]TWP49477.1 alpha/beta fold hydrolase [Lentzea tibetensis]
MTAAPDATTDVIGGPNPVVGLRRKDIFDSLGSVLTEAVRNSRHTADSLGNLVSATVDIVRGRAAFQPGAKDRRFADSAWSENFLYRRLLQLYLAADAELDSWLAGTRLSEVDRERARFVLSLVLDAVAPSNLPVSPVAIKRFVETGGLSAVSGVRQLIADVRHNGGLPRQVDTESFTLGENIATTEGAVVFRNEVLELIQYTPRTDEVRRRPVVITPPQINKYYVFDLSPEKSLVRYALDTGHQVFAVSWRNPTTEHRNWDLGTYLSALEEALDAVCAITRQRDVNLVGACSGGITSVALAAYLAARGRHLVHALTLYVSVFDTAEDRTLLGVFASEETLAAAKRRSHASGVLDGRELGRVFSLLRPNDLIWFYWVNNYLLGNKPPAFDVLYWNNDTTRLPAALHGQLIDIYRDNSLATPGAVVVNGTPIDLGRIDCDTFVLAGTTDHITPWEACRRSSSRLGGEVEFVLSNSGHVQSILNPPGNPRASYYVNDDGSTKDWRAGATKTTGSWWPHWTDWLGTRSGTWKKAPRSLGNQAHAPLVPAPGTYVHG